MSYDGIVTNVELSDFGVTFSGNFSAGDYLNFTTRTNTISGLTVGTAVLNVPAGSYLVKSAIGANRTAESDNFTYQLELNGSLVGNLGQTETGGLKKIGVDHVAAAFDLKETATLKLKIISATLSAWTIDADYCYLYFIRST
tara:strand:+ start:1862 stop:2287 length:426 start_codon:yes stop_codon:yes gene_type:complete